MEAKKKATTNQLQARFLKARIETAQRVASREIYELGKDKVPAEVTKAKHIVDAWVAKSYAKQKKIQGAAQARLKKSADAVWQAVLFSEPAAALKAVEQFEQRPY